MLIALNSFSQVIENVDFNLIDNKIVIYYDLLDCDSKYTYEVDIRFVDDRGNTIIPRNLTGDYGRVSCGRNKKVEWDLFQQVNEFEGNYKAVVTIAEIFDNKGRPIVVARGMRIVSIKESNNNVEAQINQNLKVGTLFYVNSNQGIASTTGSSVKKVGKLKVAHNDISTSTANFYLNKNLTSNMVERHLANLNLQKFRRYDLSFYTNLSIGEYYNTVLLAVGLSADYKFFDNRINIGLDLGYQIILSNLDFTIYFGTTPYLLNSKSFSLGFFLQPFSMTEYWEMLDDEYYYLYGPRIGFLCGFEFSRFKIIPSLGFYPSYEGDDGFDDLSFDYYAPFVSITLKYRVN